MRGFEIQLYISYANEHLLPGGPVHMGLQAIDLWDMQAAAEASMNGYLLPRAILSFATIFFASQHKVSSIQQQGHALYGRTLKQLNSALSEPDCYSKDEVLLSVATLALRENFVPTGKGYYRHHICGLERILELRGPGGFTTEKSLQLLSRVRRMIVIYSVLNRTPTILARDEWKRIPWTAGPDHGLGTLCGVLADTTGMVAELDELRNEIHTNANIEMVAEREEAVYQKALNLLSLLRTWKESWDFANKSGLQDYILDPLDPDYAGERQAAPLSTNIPIAASLMLYNAALIYVLQSLMSFPSKIVHADERYHITEHYAALEICKCVPYFVAQRATLDMASLIVGFSCIRTALKTFGGVYTAAGRTIANMIRPQEHGVFAKGLWDEWSEEDLGREGCENAATRSGFEKLIEDTIME